MHALDRSHGQHAVTLPTTDCIVALSSSGMLSQRDSYLACKSPFWWVCVEGLCSQFGTCLQLLVKECMPASQVGVMAGYIRESFNALWSTIGSGIQAGPTSESFHPQRGAEGPRRRQLQHSHQFVGWCERETASALLLQHHPF